MLDSAKRTSMTMLEQLKIDMDNKIEYVNKLSNSLVFNQKMDMLVRDNQTVYTYEDLMKDMMGFTKSDFIYDYYVYFANSDEVVTSTIKIDPKHFYDNVYNYEDVQYEKWYSMLHEYHFRQYMSATPLNAYGSQTQSVITFMQTIPITRSNALAQAIILIDESKIKAVIDKMNWASGAHIYVLNKSSETILTSKNAPVISDDIKQVMNTTSGVVDHEQNAENFIVSFQISDDTGWKYIMVTPKSKFFTQINRIKVNGYTILVICILIGSVLACVYTYKNYRPIKEISNIIGHEDSGNIQSNNEFEHIRSFLIQTIEKKKELKDIINVQAPIMRSSYFTKLMKGYPRSTGNEKDSLGFLGIELQSDRFMVIITEISDRCGFFKDHTEEEWMLGRFILMNVGEELFNNEYRCYFVEIDHCRVAFILNLQQDCDGIHQKNEFEQIYTLYNEVIEKKWGLSITCGVSNQHTGMIQLRECYDEAMKALEYSTVKGKGGIIYFEELSRGDSYYYYPIDIEIQMINLLRSGDYENAIQMVDMIIEVNFKSRRISYETGKCLIIEMISTYMKVMNVILAKSGESTIPMDDMVKNVLGSSTIEEMSMKMKEMADSICKLVKKNQGTPGEKLVNEVIAYIRDNFSDNSLSLKSIAERFDITPQYVSTLFKKHTSENIKDFISQIRLEKAKEYLADSSLTTSQIAEMLGYADEKGVIRLFKKCEGITPGSYRKSIGTE